MRLIYVIMFISFSISSFAQEILTGLTRNPVVWEKAREISLQKAYLQQDTIPVLLPFHDDFSEGNVFPSPERWIDREAYVNTDYPIYPINLGVVTLDAINDSGNMYLNAIPGPSTFIADHLTSRFIRLDSVFSPLPKALTPADSVYLSFYYQPQGRGLTLTSGDSLSLRFLIREAYDTLIGQDTVPEHIEAQWMHVWASDGMKLDTFYYYGNHWFRRVMIPITDPRLFKKNFQFQFYNHVSLASIGQPSWQSNGDPWNIDEVYLNAGRSQGDTVFPEIRFMDRPPSMLKRYTAMPYKQYSDDPGSEMNDTLSVLMTNRDVTAHSCRYKYVVTQPGGSFTKSFQTAPFTMQSYLLANFGYNERAPVTFFFPISQSDSNLFMVTHTVKDDSSPMGDTVVAYQRFFNYYAYDDGTPEQGYGLKGANSMLAYRFMLNVSPDTLRAIRIYFNKTLTASNQQYFWLTVWNDNNNKPGDTLYSRYTRVEYSDSLNNFLTYYLENPVVLTGNFYIGTIQTTDENLNIGYDSYNNAQTNTLFNVDGSWQNSVLNGALMMRPVIGKKLPVGVAELPSASERRLTIYPNPGSGNVNIITNGSEDQRSRIIISNMTGLQVQELPFSPVISVSGLSSGLYLVTVIRPDGTRSSAKLIITH